MGMGTGTGVSGTETETASAEAEAEDVIGLEIFCPISRPACPTEPELVSITLSRIGSIVDPDADPDVEAIKVDGAAANATTSSTPDWPARILSRSSEKDWAR